MKKLVSYLFFGLCITGTMLFSQDEKEFKRLFVQADGYFLINDYMTALPTYLDLIEIEPMNSNINYLIGICYLNIPGKHTEAIPYLEKGANNVSNEYIEGSYKEKQAPAEAIFYLAKAYRMVGNIDMALESYTKYRSILDVGEIYFIEYVDLQLNNCKNARELIKTSINFTKKPLSDLINTEEDEHNPVFANNILIFSRQKLIRERELNEEFFITEIFQSNYTNNIWKRPKNINLIIGSEGYSTSSYLSTDGNQLLVTRDDYGVYNIYETNRIGSSWSELRKIKKGINSKSNEKSASLTKDGNTMYFESDIYGGYGGKDIYTSTKNKKGNWSDPVNLGPAINTPFNEETPFFLDINKTLYFSSEGHFNMGGLDVFYSQLQESGDWSEPLNIGYPINTFGDDYGYYPINETEGFYATYEDNSLINKDIYRIKILPQTVIEDIIADNENVDESKIIEKVEIKDSIFTEKLTDLQVEIKEEDEVIEKLEEEIEITTSRTGTVVYGIPEITINGVINLQDNKEQFDNFNVNIINTANNNTVGNVVPDNFGAFSYVVNPGNYKLVFSGNGYKENSTIINIPIEYTRKTAEVNIEMVPIEVSSGEYFVIKSVFFDYNDFSLIRNSKIELEKLSALMQRNPSLYLEVIGHTDSKGRTEYNFNLSKKRARSVIEYISGNGINNERFVAMGAGEVGTIALNQNPDGTDNPEGRKYNRRVDIKILRSNNDNITIQDIYVPEHLRLKGSLKYTILLVETTEKLGPEYFNKYDKDAITNIWISPTSNGYAYSVGEYINKSRAIPLLNKAIDIGFPKAKIINNLELKKLHDSGTPTAKAAKQKEKENLKTGTFTIQLMALKKPVDISYFNNLSNVKKYIGKDGYTRYAYGEYKGYYAAKSAIQEIVERGYNDAFVVNVARFN